MSHHLHLNNNTYQYFVFSYALSSLFLIYVISIPLSKVVYLHDFSLCSLSFSANYLAFCRALILSLYLFLSSSQSSTPINVTRFPSSLNIPFYLHVLSLWLNGLLGFFNTSISLLCFALVASSSLIIIFLSLMIYSFYYNCN